jgi:adenylyltransferase/sulfurtransferase
MQDDPLKRYSRQTILEEIGKKGQELLGNSHVAVVGCGALGSVICDHLARAGVGKIDIIDRDVVELENLQRQILFDENDIGAPKAISAKEKLGKINTSIDIQGIVRDLNPTNIEKIIKDVDIVLDGTDNMETRYLINDTCVKNNIPWIYGGAVSTYGMSMNIIPNVTACLACAFPHLPKSGTLPTCDTVGVLNTIPSIIASIQTTEALKILLKKDFNTNLVIYDVWRNDFQSIKIKQSSECECCKKHNFEYLSAQKVEAVAVLCGRDSVQISPPSENEISLQNLAERLKNVGEVKVGTAHLSFKTEELIISIFRDGRAIIKGTDDKTLAKSIYAKYIGN